MTRALATRKKLIYVEVKDRTENISRVISKSNLCLVIQSKNNNDLFDKYWYQKRRELSEETPYEGWVVDSTGQVQAEIHVDSRFGSSHSLLADDDDHRPRGFSISSE